MPCQSQDRCFSESIGVKVSSDPSNYSYLFARNEHQVLQKKQRSPKYTDKQLQQIPTRARRLYRMLLNNDFELVLDDERYFSLSDQSVSTNRGFYTSDKGKTPPEVKQFKRTEKYESKVLV
jgi:hypothetical protein